MYCSKCGQEHDADAKFCRACGAGISGAPINATHVANSLELDSRRIATIADYERASAIIWLILGIVQVLSIVAIIAGVWNIIAATSRFKMSPSVFSSLLSISIFVI